MTALDDSHDEMSRARLDDGTAERLISGHVEPDDAPPGYARLVHLLRAAAAPVATDELVAEERMVSAAADLVRGRSSGRVPSSPSTGRSTARARFFRAKVVGFVVAGTLVGSTGLAFAGALPGPAQDAVSHVLANVGIHVPTSHPASTGPEISKLATTTDTTGVQKGATISSTASGGVSQAGEHGKPSQTPGPPVVTPNPGGTGTAGSASAGASDAGTGQGNQHSGGASSSRSSNSSSHGSHP